MSHGEWRMANGHRSGNNRSETMWKLSPKNPSDVTVVESKTLARLLPIKTRSDHLPSRRHSRKTDSNVNGRTLDASFWTCVGYKYTVFNVYCLDCELNVPLSHKFMPRWHSNGVAILITSTTFASKLCENAFGNCFDDFFIFSTEFVESMKCVYAILRIWCQWIRVALLLIRDKQNNLQNRWISNAISIFLPW